MDASILNYTDLENFTWNLIIILYVINIWGCTTPWTGFYWWYIELLNILWRITKQKAIFIFMTIGFLDLSTPPPLPMLGIQIK